MKIFTLVAAGCLTLLTSTANAAMFNTFSDRSSFLAATSSVQVEDFNSFLDEVSFNGQNLIIGDLTLRNDNPNAGRGLIDVPPHIFGVFSIDGTANASFVVNKNFNSVVLSFANPITAFGADFAAMNNDSLAVEFEVLGERITPPTQTGSTVQFFGFTSDIAFSSVSLVGSSAVSAYDGFSGDNFAFGQTKVSTVPLPASIALMLVAFGGLFGLRRRAA